MVFFSVIIPMTIFSCGNKFSSIPRIRWRAEEKYFHFEVSDQKKYSFWTDSVLSAYNFVTVPMGHSQILFSGDETGWSTKRGVAEGCLRMLIVLNLGPPSPNAGNFCDSVTATGSGWILNVGFVAGPLGDFSLKNQVISMHIFISRYCKQTSCNFFFKKFYWPRGH